jgi:hypothetical protein
MNRKNIILFIFITFVLAFSALNVLAEDAIKIRARVDKEKISMDGQIIYTVTISGDTKGLSDELILPEFKGFTPYTSGTSKSITIINGEMSVSNIYTYVLSPEIPGKYEIQGVSLRWQGKTYQSNPVAVEILAGTSSGRIPVKTYKQASSSFGSSRGFEERKNYKSKEDKRFFVMQELDKKECFVNEQVTMSFRFYTSERLLPKAEYQEASLDGFWKEDLPPQRRYYEMINGVKYLVTEINTAIFPIRSGDLEIGSALLKCKIPQKTGRRRSSFADDFFGFFADDGFDVFGRSKLKVFKTKPINLKVKSLPEKGKPKDFSGATGFFNIRASIDKKNVKVGEAINLVIEFFGEGNINSIKLPDLTALENFNVFVTDKSSRDIYKEDNKVKGKNTQEIVLVPVKSGKLEIPSIGFSYFDPREQKYKRAETKPIKINVKKGMAMEKDVVMDYSRAPIEKKENIKLMREDIKHIKQETGDIYKKFDKKNISWIVLVLILFPLLIGLQLIVKFISSKRNLTILKQKNAYKNTKKGLNDAGNLLKQKKIEDFYQCSAMVLKNYIADKLDVSAQSITIDDIKRKLKIHKIDKESITQIITLLDTADFARFASLSVDKQGMSEHLKQLKNIINNLEKKWI